MAAHVVHLTDLAAVGHHVDGLAVILHIQPVTHLHTVAIHRQLLVMLDIVDHQRDQLFGELIGAVVVGAAGNVHRHSVGVVEGHHKHIGAGLAAGIGAVRAQGRGFHKIALGPQRAVHFVGGNLQVFFALFPCFGIGIIPCLFGALQQIYRAHHIALHKNFGVGNAAVHMAFGGKVDHIVKIILPEQAGHQLFIADIALHKHMAGVALYALQIFQVAGISQLI